MKREEIFVKINRNHQIVTSFVEKKDDTKSLQATLNKRFLSLKQSRTGYIK